MLKRIAIVLLKIYKKFISPLLPPACRFTPTCSEYMMEAISVYGFFKGFFLGFKRLLRCHPLEKGGFDPVPQWKKDSF